MNLSSLQEVGRRLRAAFPFSHLPFEEAALEVFRFQAQANPVYAEWLGYLRRDWRDVQRVAEIPFLPIQFYKTREVTSRADDILIHTFYSSRTTGQVASKHVVYDFGLYHKASKLGFEACFGALETCFFVSLLPSYSQTGESSLVYMVQYFAQQAGQLDGAATIGANIDRLRETLLEAAQLGKKPIVFGVTHALLEVAKQGRVELPFTLIETGGMKGRGVELTREELQAQLAEAFPYADIRSEYGMTELFSQGYTTEHRGLSFTLPPWMGALLRDPVAPLDIQTSRPRGGLNIIDLANVDTCAFLATEDLAEIKPDGLAILGRLDHAEIRGCNLLTF